MQNAHGVLEYARPHDEVLVLRGWMVDAKGPFETIRIVVRGEHLGDAQVIDRPDLALAVTTIPMCEASGFHVEVPLGILDEKGRVEILLEGVRRGQAQAVMKVGWMLSAVDSPMPPAHLSQRVAHTDLDYLYQAGGVKSAFDYYRVAKRHGVKESARVLDWGCGPGRVATHMRHLFEGGGIYGSDLDHEALRWGAAHLPDVHFTDGGTVPPLPFEDDSFDLITGGSVFTHLTWEMQQVWLLELRRLLAPGGRALVTTLGTFASEMRCTDSALCERFQSTGFDDETLDATLDGVAPKGYYRATWQSVEWTKENWSRFVDVLEVEEAGYENYQDLWVIA